MKSQSYRDLLAWQKIATGSLAELDTQRIIAEQLTFLSPESSSDLDRRITEIRKMLYSLSSKLES